MNDTPDYTIVDTEPCPPAFSDEALALRFSAKHCDHLRYVAAWGRWLIWTGAVWQLDKTMYAFCLARTICREASAECNEEKIAVAVASAKTVAAVERLARADRKHAATVDQWDADPWLLNTPRGVVDLRTGKLRPAKPDDYMTKITAVAPGVGCPQWMNVLERVTDGDKELATYLQRVIGYALTGSTSEQALFFVYGTGGNGKGILINTVTGIMGGYAAVASMETFTASNSSRHPTDLAMLRGARLVSAQETDKGRRWDESRVKALTGGDPITARFMRRDFFTFPPQFKLLIAGNHRPELQTVDDAIRRRFNLIPFNAKIMAGERDRDLPEKLKIEWPGILTWAIDGCLAWQSQGLDAPTAVTKATDDYLTDEDALGLWIAECCRVSALNFDTINNLFTSWKRWAEASGEPVVSKRRLGHSLALRGFKSHREGGTGRSGYLGIAVVPG